MTCVSVVLGLGPLVFLHQMRTDCICRYIEHRPGLATAAARGSARRIFHYFLLQCLRNCVRFFVTNSYTSHGLGPRAGYLFAKSIPFGFVCFLYLLSSLFGLGVLAASSRSVR